MKKQLEDDVFTEEMLKKKSVAELKEISKDKDL